MHNLLSKLLARKGIKDVSQLSEEEKKTFDGYEKVFNKEELTLEEVKKFLEQQIKIIEMKWKDLTIDKQKKAELIPYHTAYKVLSDAISAPQVEREALEQYLNQQLQ